MKKAVLILSAVFCMLTVMYGQNTKRVAILPIVDIAQEFTPGQKLMVRGIITDVISNIEGYTGVDRVNSSLLRDEQQKFQKTGSLSKAEYRQIGQDDGLEYIIVVTLSMFDSENLVFQGQIIDATTGEIEKSGTAAAHNDLDSYREGCKTLVQRLFKLRVPQQGGNSSSGSGSNTTQVTVQPSSNQDYIENIWNINMGMVWVEGGSFLMGATGEQGGEGESDEQNIRRVNLDGFYIAQTEVTQAQWEAVMGTNVTQQRNKKGASESLAGVGPNLPMYYVNWDEAMAFCEELSRHTGKKYTLPTEAQWEYAARGGAKSTKAKYSGSSAIDVVAWYDGNSGSRTHDVATKRPNELGIYDMSGNVWEWCYDWYSSSYNSNDTDNPQGASSGSYRVLRGGSWFSCARSCRVSSRGRYSPSGRFYCGGFRVVCLP